MAELESVVLYRAARPYWLVDARIDDELGLAVCSGDNNAEWTLRIMPEDLERLTAALRRRLDEVGGSAALRGTVTDLPKNEVLLLLLENFGFRDDNPFDTIKRFLSQSRVPASADFWGSM